jgi:hypothetical protein
VRPGRTILGVALVAVAVVGALLAADVRSRAAGLQAGDLRFAQDPAAARWSASVLLPGDPALRLLGVRGDLAFRRTAQRAAAVRAAGNGFDNGVSESRTRAEVEALLADESRSGDARIASAAANLLGILAFDDSKQIGASAPAPVERSVADFQDAIRRDPGNDDAKFNLELLLRELVAKGVRPGSNSAPGGPAQGRRGAGAGLPGHGY